MALSPYTIFECNGAATSGNVNGGGFNPQSLYMLADLTTDANTANTASPVCSSASYNFAAGDVGAWLYIKSGTNWTPGWYQIASVASNKATLAADVGEAVQVVNNIFGPNTVAGCATVGTPTSGAFTVDYSQRTSAIIAPTNLSSPGSTTVIISASNPFTPVMIGNLIHITNGTNFTKGWYEIIAFNDASTVVLDRIPNEFTTASSGEGQVGGAISLGGGVTGSTDSNVFNLATKLSSTSAARFFLTGNFNMYTTITATSGGDSSYPVIYEGYATMRGDRPLDDTRPNLNFTSSSFFTAPTYTNVYCLSFTANSGGSYRGTLEMPTTGTSLVYGCKSINTSLGGVNGGFSGSGTFTNCEASGNYGFVVPTGSVGATFYNNYIHDCAIGIYLGVGGALATQATIVGNIITNTILYSIIFGQGTSGTIMNNTLYGASTPTGVGLSIGNPALIMNNIICGFTDGISNGGITPLYSYSDYNNFYNNTNNVTAGWPIGANDLFVDPQFTNVVEINGATATTTAGNHLVQSGATFVSAGVTPGVDFLHILSGTGVTAGIYKIASVDSQTQITVDGTLTANATADKVWYITTGQNYGIQENLNGKGFPGAFPGGLTTGYIDIGAPQRLPNPQGSYTFVF